MMHVELYTDGACKGNPGPGGWGCWLRYQGRERIHERELCGGELQTTNNRMELMAVIMGLNLLDRPCQVELTLDSQYVQLGLTEWMPQWKRRGWRTADRKPVKNVDLWQRLDAACARHTIRWNWVRGHSGHPGNERADQLANQGIPTPPG